MLSKVTKREAKTLRRARLSEDKGCDAPTLQVVSALIADEVGSVFIHKVRATGLPFGTPIVAAGKEGTTRFPLATA